MIEPKRLLDDGSAPDAATGLLRSLAVPAPPSPAKQAELAQHLAALAHPPVVAAAGAALWLKALALATLGVAATWGVLTLRNGARPLESPRPAASARAAAVAVALVAPPAPAAPAPEPLGVANSARPEASAELPAASTHSKPSARDHLAEEEALLEQARRLAASSPSSALGLLRKYQQRFPAGQLAAERMFLSVDVLTRLGNAAAAQRQADALIRAFPNSVYAAQVKARRSTP
jgi:hypothetical protein